MDGYTAARGIRAWEHETGARPVPILALTAHALPEEAHRSVEAGCTAHLTKPIRKTTILAAIEEHGLGCIRVEVDASLAELLPGFVANRRLDILSIPTALEHGRFDEIRILGHNMKGSGAGYELLRISEIGDGLEQAALRKCPESAGDFDPGSNLA
jgi:hypothetical protein